MDDAKSALARRGWARFLWLNYACGAVLTTYVIAVRWAEAGS